MRKKFHESAEDYLEAILMLSEELPVVRSIDIANHLGFSKPSVSIAVNKLFDEKYIDIGEHSYITLTEKGMALATRVYDRHKTLTKCLESLGVDPVIAEEDACKIEHVISEESFQAVKNYFVDNFPEEMEKAAATL
ncbi:MAG: metal-dependent transcriptional regulator [Lachnospiraceae bacterium]|nr:metal-dependent transcriptional regulator [Lachnospiraceae bacterium]